MRHTIRFCLLSVILIASTFASTSRACLWDYDTLKAEAAGLPGITEIITGRFDRFPPLYYEMRLERDAKELESDPDNLDLYDNAGVACDRLGRSDEAIEWMAKKRTMLDTLAPLGGDLSHHEYTYLANLGTFHIHRWLKNGADRTDMTDAQRARELIADAIELNPGAHFGRERYQLLAIEWILSNERDQRYNHDNLLNMIKSPVPEEPIAINYRHNVLAAYGYDDAVEGLSGLVTLGNAWQSIDIYLALAYALIDQGNTVLAHLTLARIDELYENGSTSLSSILNPDKLDGSAPFDRIGDTRYANKITSNYFPAARAEADSWVAARNAYATELLQQGQHPDTHPNFWDDWHETTSPPAYPANFSLRSNLQLISAIVISCCVVLLYINRCMKRRKPPPEALA